MFKTAGLNSFRQQIRKKLPQEQSFFRLEKPIMTLMAYTDLAWLIKNGITFFIVFLNFPANISPDPRDESSALL